MYRVRRENKGIVCFMNNADLDLFNRQNTTSNKDMFEFYPFKPYWYYRLKWFITPLMIKSNEYMRVITEKNKHFSSILKWILAIIGGISAILYIIEFNNN